MTVHIKYLELCLAHSENSINMLLCVKKKKVAGLTLGKIVGWQSRNKK